MNAHISTERTFLINKKVDMKNIPIFYANNRGLGRDLRASQLNPHYFYIRKYTPYYSCLYLLLLQVIRETNTMTQSIWKMGVGKNSMTFKPKSNETYLQCPGRRNNSKRTTTCSTTTYKIQNNGNSLR